MTRRFHPPTHLPHWASERMQPFSRLPCPKLWNLTSHLPVTCNRILRQVEVGVNSSRPVTPPSPSAKAKRKSGTGEGERLWGRSVKGAGVNEEGGGEGGGEGGEMLPGLETRVLDLKNHFPVAMRLLSLVMEDCQVIVSCDSFV